MPQMGFRCLFAFPLSEATFAFTMRVCVHVCVLNCIFFFFFLSVYLGLFGPTGDCCHCCVKQIRELGGFGRITTLDFRATLKRKKQTTTKKQVYIQL